MTGWQKKKTTALLILEDGTRLEGYGIGAEGHAAGEVCFNTAMTGYQEILTDPSYAGQIITFTFPHIGNVGANDEDIETVNMAALSGVRGAVLRADVTNPSNWRAAEKLDAWLKKRNIIGISGIDTRALTARIRENGMPNGVIAHAPSGDFDEASIMAELEAFPGLEGLDLAREVSTAQTYHWDEARWKWGEGYASIPNPEFHIVAIDYGAKRNILRCLSEQGAKVTVLPATATAQDVLDQNPDGIFLSNGPGDPSAMSDYAVPAIKELMNAGKPMFGICLGHQLMGLALGGTTSKMHQGHHGANHPVKDLTTGKVEITSMNHGFAVDAKTLPPGVTQTHLSLFDGSNAGLAVDGKPIFSVQYHPEASPGPQDSHYLFTRFLNHVRAQKGMDAVPEHPKP
ncbi:carbamoyl-phosphate synthase small chain [Devosia pacifica]|uniref:Carbamoyl phosphate synthase small chain n=1 Tax=Devosia pacifica TaxID=1335967 RepID=A0A918S169_9HYPH|nr:glutamine-hydrolyzing carbamoyl-phosphate synthase small subunit [Devosia pacifica]GHA16579.1 carbamoyl-phosphate synthase small chain [Devosia pacifica]